MREPRGISAIRRGSRARQRAPVSPWSGKGGQGAAAASASAKAPALPGWQISGTACSATRVPPMQAQSWLLAMASAVATRAAWVAFSCTRVPKRMVAPRSSTTCNIG
jgi:hypothetical protein